MSEHNGLKTTKTNRSEMIDTVLEILKETKIVVDGFEYSFEDKTSSTHRLIGKLYLSEGFQLRKN
jgi:hypothetical protein